MILPHKIRKATVFALQKDRENILNVLHKHKLFQVIDLKTADVKEIAIAESPEVQQYYQDRRLDLLPCHG